MVSNREVKDKFTTVFRLKNPPIAFFYTDNPPKEPIKPKRQRKLANRPCISQYINGVKRGNTLVIGRESKNLCTGGLHWLGFTDNFIKMPSSQFHSVGFLDKNGNVVMEGEKTVKTPEISLALLEKLTDPEAPAEYAVFMPLDQVNTEIYQPLLVIFFVNMDQLSGLIMLSHFDTNNHAKLAFGSNCTSFVWEPLLELKKGDPPRAVVGCLTECVTRRFVRKDEATFTVGYERLVEMYDNIDESFLQTDLWKIVRDRT